MTCFWQLYRGDTLYRVQTDEKQNADKMLRRKEFLLVPTSKGVWIFNTSATRPDIMLKIMKSITGNKPRKNSVEDIIYLEPTLTSAKVISTAPVSKNVPEPTLFG